MSALTETLDLRLAVSDQVVGDYALKVKCREHDDKTESLAVYRDHLHCFGCGFHEAHPLRALAYLLQVDEREAVGVAARYTAESLDRYRERAALTAALHPLPAGLATIYNEVLNGQRRERLDWLFARGLKSETINDPDVLLGHDGVRFVIPIFDTQDHLVALRYRLDPAYCDAREIAKHKYLGLKGRNGLYLYPEPLLAAAARAEEPRVLWLCEGELDALRLWQAGHPAVSVTNGAGQVEKLPALVRERYPHIQELLIATDQDEAGEEAARRTRVAAEALGYTARRVRWEEGKDVTEALQLGCRLRTE